MELDLEKIINIAEEIIKNGGEISRAEETVSRICKASGATKTDIFIIPTLISVTATINNKTRTITRRIYSNDLNLGKIEECNNEARRICNNKTTRKIIDYNYSTVTSIICIFIATGAFCIYFGGNITDALLSGITGIIISYFPFLKEFNNFSKTLIESTLAGILSYIPEEIGILNTQPDKIMIGAIMLLIPGMSIGSAIKDLISGNQISGLFVLTDAIITAGAIALGFAFATYVFGGFNA